MLAQNRSALLALPARHPVIAVALKAAVAATLAWLVVQPWGEVADRYAFYAPLGAVVSVSTTVLQSLRATVQAAIAIGIGAALGLVAMHSGMPQLAGLALVVGVGSLVASAPRLGTMASWVPISGLFVLILGREDPGGYVLGYLGLTTVGAAVGLAVNAVWPPLPLVSAVRAQHDLQQLLAEQLEGLAEGIRREPLPDPVGWSRRGEQIAAQTAEMQRLVQRASEAQRGNWRARRWRETAGRAVDHGAALANLAFAVRELTQLLAEAEHADRDEVALGPGLRPEAARALDAVAAMLRSSSDPDGGPDGAEQADDGEHRDAREAVERLASAIRERRHDVDGDFFAAGSLVIAMRRVLDGLAPPSGVHDPGLASRARPSTD